MPSEAAHLASARAEGALPETEVFSALYGEGERAQRVAAAISLDAAGLQIRPVSGEAVEWAYGDIVSGEPVRPRSVDALLSLRNDRAKWLFVDDTVFLARLLAKAPSLSIRHGRWHDARAGLVVGAVALACFTAMWAFDVSPAKTVAVAMPERARVTLGERVLATLPSKSRCTNVAGLAALQRLTTRLMPKGPITADHIIVLDVRTADDKPVINAFAVPGNRLVLTRGIIDQASNADEIAAVIGHEAGHAIELHPETSLVRMVGFWALVEMVFTGTPGAVSNVGVVLAQLSYSRAAEREADGHALRLLREAHISPKPMAEFFRRMQERERAAPNNSGANDLFDSHPSNPERVARIESQQPYETRPALGDADWRALRSICVAYDPVAEAKRVRDDAEAAAAREDSQRRGSRQAAERAEALRQEALKAEARRAAAAKLEAERAAAAKAAAERATEAKAAADRIAAEREAARLQAEKAAAAEAVKTTVVASNSATPPQASAAPPVAAGPATPEMRLAAASARITANPQDAAAFFERGQLLAGKADLAAAIGDFSRALALRPDDANMLFWRASVYARVNEVEKAIADYSRVVRLQPRNFAAYNNRGSLYKTQKRLELALSDYSTALAIDGSQAITLTNRALVYRDRKNLAAALADLDAAIAANPQYASAYVRRGETFELKAQREAAIADYRSALKLPDSEALGSEPKQTARARLKALGVDE